MSNELAKTEKRSLLVELADQAGLEPQKFYATMQQMCGCAGATPEHFAGLMLTARRLNLDPITRQLYMMKTQRGVQIVVPVDGYLSILRRQPDLVGHTCVIGEDDIGGVYAEVTIYTASQVSANLPPFKHREYMNECKGNTGPWRSHPLRMLKHKAYSQAVRYRFGVYAPDEDEFRSHGLAEDDEPRVVPADIAPAVPIEALGGDPAIRATELSAEDTDADVVVLGDDKFDPDKSARLDAEVAEAEQRLFDG